MYSHILIVYANTAGVEAHWGDIGAAMYPVFLEANSICVSLGVCKEVSPCSEDWKTTTLLDYPAFIHVNNPSVT